MVDGQLLHPGKLGSQVSVEMGQEAAARAALQALSALRHHLGGSLDRLQRILQLTVFVAADAEFVEHPKVANGASDTLIAVLGPDGRHARAADRGGVAATRGEHRDHGRRPEVPELDRGMP